MNPTGAAIIRAVFRAARPWSILAGVLLYAIGGGIAAYLGNPIDWPAYWLGQGAVTMLQLSSYQLHEYFNRSSQPPFEQLPRQRRRPTDAPPGLSEEDSSPIEIIVPRLVFFQVAAATLTIGAVLTVLLYAEHLLNPAAFLFLGLAFVLSFAYAVPPFRLAYSGYGELVLSILVANLFPALAYLLQVGELHRLLAMLTFPLTFLFLAAALALSLRGYMDDIRKNQQTMLVRVGWQRGMTLHNALIALAYIVMAITFIAGRLPLRLAFPIFLPLPVAAFQIWQMNRIAGGAKPRWNLLQYTALATIGLTVYFMIIALWTS
jgi:1,4-dihydroxy-2-naphthoate octaprenyltransferase